MCKKVELAVEKYLEHTTLTLATVVSPSFIWKWLTYEDFRFRHNTAFSKEATHTEAQIQ